jgi:hypothetical protein
MSRCDVPKFICTELAVCADVMFQGLSVQNWLCVCRCNVPKFSSIELAVCADMMFLSLALKN